MPVHDDRRRDDPPPNASPEVTELTGSIYRSTQRIVVGIVGATILVSGTVMLLLPGPGLLLILAGLSLLATEFALARLWLRRLREQLARVEARARKITG